MAAVDSRHVIRRREGRSFEVRGKEGGIGDDGRDILRRDVGRGGKGEVTRTDLLSIIYVD